MSAVVHFAYRVHLFPAPPTSTSCLRALPAHTLLLPPSKIIMNVTPTPPPRRLHCLPVGGRHRAPPAHLPWASRSRGRGGVQCGQLQVRHRGRWACWRVGTGCVVCAQAYLIFTDARRRCWWRSVRFPNVVNRVAKPRQMWLLLKRLFPSVAGVPDHSGRLPFPIAPDPSAGDGEVRVFSVPDGGWVGSCRGHKKAVTGTAFSPDGWNIATSSGAGGCMR